MRSLFSLPCHGQFWNRRGLRTYFREVVFGGLQQTPMSPSLSLLLLGRAPLSVSSAREHALLIYLSIFFHHVGRFEKAELAVLSSLFSLPRIQRSSRTLLTHYHALLFLSRRFLTKVKAYFVFEYRFNICRGKSDAR